MLEIRRMEKEDIPYVQQVAKVSWNDTYAGIIPLHIQEKFIQNAYSEESLLTRLEQSNFWVAEVEGKVVGFANFSSLHENGEVELGAIYLLPHFQGKGIGSALLQQGLNEIAGIKRLVLNVEKDNLKGLHFYKKKGFSIDTEYDEIFHGHVLKTVRLVLNLS